ncbi:hypothetical protein C8Q78DRAFT_449710 [Trametes maxima]|nr:hypothetical protein C8Q78DRAFT_449710 [Trametes maxima]
MGVGKKEDRGCSCCPHGSHAGAAPLGSSGGLLLVLPSGAALGSARARAHDHIRPGLGASKFDDQLSVRDRDRAGFAGSAWMCMQLSLQLGVVSRLTTKAARCTPDASQDPIRRGGIAVFGELELYDRRRPPECSPANRRTAAVSANLGRKGIGGGVVWHQDNQSDRPQRCGPCWASPQPACDVEYHHRVRSEPTRHGQVRASNSTRCIAQGRGVDDRYGADGR